MESNMKLAAERLLKIADDLEKEAADNTYFVCDGCNHTASLASINGKRRIAAEKHNVSHVANVTVNDAVTYLACGGKMSYVPTDESSKFYVEAVDDPEGESEELDIFESVDDQEKKKDEQGLPEDIPEDIPEAEESPEEKAPSLEKGPVEDKPLEISDKSPEEVSDMEAPKMDEPVIEETVTEDVVEKKPAKKKKKDIEIPKEDVPKFEKMPKEARDAFFAAVAKYSV